MELTAFYSHGLHGKVVMALRYATTTTSLEGRVNRLDPRHTWSASRAHNKCLMIWRMGWWRSTYTYMRAKHCVRMHCLPRVRLRVESRVCKRLLEQTVHVCSRHQSNGLLNHAPEQPGLRCSRHRA